MAGSFKYTKEEKDINKVIKYNMDISKNLLNDKDIALSRKKADENIKESKNILTSLGYTKELEEVYKNISVLEYNRLINSPKAEDWETILLKAENEIPYEVLLEDILTKKEMENAFKELEQIEKDFSKKTSIFNKTDLSFLALATSMQVAKALIFPYIAKEFEYGESFDASKRLSHDDPSIKKEQKQSQDKFKDKHLKKNKPGNWTEILYRTPPYDTTVGSKDIGKNMGGKYHRFYTLGHDPVLGWIFGTANILTDVITLNTFLSYRVKRQPKLHITPETVPMAKMFYESYLIASEDKLNLPAAICAQAIHLKSDAYTKVGLPVPLLTVIDELFASHLYKSQYDALCLARDTKIVGASYAVSIFFDICISLLHGLFRQTTEPQELYEVRTRKILLISNAVASTSSVINAYITQNPKNLDIASLLSTAVHLIMDTRFMAKVKEEFIQNEIDEKLKIELDEIDRMYQNI